MEYTNCQLIASVTAAINFTGDLAGKFHYWYYYVENVEKNKADITPAQQHEDIALLSRSNQQIRKRSKRSFQFSN